MSKKQLVIQHDLSKLSNEDLEQYKRDVSAFIGLDPDLNGLDTIWMDNENGPGRSLVLYARRGTAEILREINKIEVSSLTSQEVRGSMVFTAVGKNFEGRQEIATGSKSLMDTRLGVYLAGKALDNAIMTASTRALRRLTMQFTKLGILDESEIDAVQGSTANPAAGATLAGSAVVLPPAPTVVNNAPGRDITIPGEPAGYGISNPPKLAPAAVPTSEPPRCVDCKQPLAEHDFVAGQGVVCKSLTIPSETSAKADIQEVPHGVNAVVTPVVAPVTVVSQPDIKAAEISPSIPPEIVSKPRRARRARNTVSMDGPEPEVVSAASPASAAPISVPAPVSASVETAPKTETVPPQAVAAVPTLGTDFPGKPTDVQMGEYRKRVSVYTSELPSSENMGSVQKMRAFITRMSGAAPQFMTTDQWEEMLGWFESFVAKNAVKGLVKYINDSLGVK